MSLESDVAGQAVNLELELVRFLGQSAAKIVGKLSAGTIALIVATYKKFHTKKDLTPGENNIKSITDTAREHGYELQELYVPAKIKKEFAKTLKKRGISAAFVKNKGFDPPVYTTVVMPYDAPRVDRIIEELKIDTVDVSQGLDPNAPTEGQREHMTEMDADNFFEAMNPEEVIEEPDPFPTSRTAEDRSKNGSENIRSESTEGIRKGKSDKPDVIYQYETVDKMREANNQNSSHDKKDVAVDTNSKESRTSIMDRMNQIKEKRKDTTKKNAIKETVISFAEKVKEIKERGREQ